MIDNQGYPKLIDFGFAKVRWSTILWNRSIDAFTNQKFSSVESVHYGEDIYALWNTGVPTP